MKELKESVIEKLLSDQTSIDAMKCYIELLKIILEHEKRTRNI